MSCFCDRPAVEVVATSLLVHITSARAMLRKQYDGRSSLFNNGVEPTVKEVQMNLLEAMYGATSSSVPSAKMGGAPIGTVPLKKAIRLLKCLDAGVIDPYWSMVPYRVSDPRGCADCAVWVFGIPNALMRTTCSV